MQMLVGQSPGPGIRKHSQNSLPAVVHKDCSALRVDGRVDVVQVHQRQARLKTTIYHCTPS